MDDKDIIENSAITAKIESETDNSVQLDIPEIQEANESNVPINERNKESITSPKPKLIFVEEIEKVKELEKVKLETEKKFEGVEKINEPVEDTTIPMVFEPESIFVKETKKAGEFEKVELVTAKISEEFKKVNAHVEDKETTIEFSEPVQQVTLYKQSTLISDKSVTSINLTESTISTQKSPTVSISQENLIERNQQEVVDNSDFTLCNDIQFGENGVDLDQQSILSMKDSELKDLIMREFAQFLTDEPSQNFSSFEIKSSLAIDEEQKITEDAKNIRSEASETITEEKKNENIVDALSILATATLNQDLSTMDNIVSTSTQPVMQTKEPIWSDVGIINGNSCVVENYYSASTTDEHENISLDNLPNYMNKMKIDIQPGQAYKFRVAAINTCGRGEWSEISAFRTCLPGYPGAPFSIKITKVLEGINLTWEVPITSYGEIVEYSVCMAIKSPKEKLSSSSKPMTTNLNFARVYCGPLNNALIGYDLLGAAHIDRTNKPAILFRIAAKNDKGYGPATQVRWLQDGNNVPGLKNNRSIKREKSVNLLTTVPKKPKI